MDEFYQKVFEKLGGIPNAKIDVDSFAAYLKRNSIDLPHPVFQLLSHHGGEFFNEDVEITNVGSVPVASSGRIGLGSVADVNDLKDISQIKEYMPDEVFPIMGGAAGDHIVVGIGEFDHGKIYYWYHEANYGEELTLIFNSFEDFVNNIKPYEEDENDPREIISFRIDF
jgi:SMI1 / KNR4 family (SUKH-1)